MVLHEAPDLAVVVRGTAEAMNLHNVTESDGKFRLWVVGPLRGT